MALSENYFKSKDVRVFPSSFRGTYDNTTTFDPEARLNTEANFIVPKISGNKASYIVNYNTNTIKFVLGGYYFEINNITDYDLNDKYLNIKLRDFIIAENQDADNKDSERRTSLLDTWEANNDHILDSSDEDTNISYFSGLKISSISPEEAAYANIKLFDAEGNINQKAILVDLDHGSGENTLMHGVGLIADTTNQTVFGTYNDNKADTLFEIGNGSGETNKHNALEISTTTVNINNNTNINGETVITGATKIDGSTEITNNTEIKGIVNISNDTESESTTTGALKVAGGIGVGKNLNVNGNANLTNKVIIKATPSEDETNVKVDGTLNVTGKTDIYNNITVDSAKTTLAKPVEITDNSDNALVVKGKTTIEKDLEVGNNTKILAVKNSPSTGEQNVTITGTLKSTDKALFENGLEVASGKPTNLGGQVDITGAVNINTSNQKNPGNITIYGETKITGKVTINGKATSNSTTSTDGSTTLTTKDYVDNKINALDVDSVGADGSYLKTIYEKDGQIKATAQAFDKTIEDSDNNAPTSKAVYNHITDRLGELKLNKVGGKSSSKDPNGETINIFKYVANVSQTDGKLAAEAQAIITDLNSFSSSTEEGKLVSATATKNYVNTKIQKDIISLEDSIESKINLKYLDSGQDNITENEIVYIWTARNQKIAAGSWVGPYEFALLGASRILAVSLTGRLADHSTSWREWNITGGTDKDDAESTLGYAANFYASYSDCNLYIGNANAKYDGAVDMIVLFVKKR